MDGTPAPATAVLVVVGVALLAGVAVLVGVAVVVGVAVLVAVPPVGVGVLVAFFVAVGVGVWVGEGPLRCVCPPFPWSWRARAIDGQSATAAAVLRNQRLVARLLFAELGAFFVSATGSDRGFGSLVSGTSGPESVLMPH